MSRVLRGDSREAQVALYLHDAGLDMSYGGLGVSNSLYLRGL